MRIYLLIAAILISLTEMFATSNLNYVVDNYSTETGFPHDFALCVHKSDEGMLWFGTWYGLVSYDGGKYKVFANNNNDLSREVPRKIHHIEEDNQGNLWIKTIDHKLYVYYPRKEQFVTVYDQLSSYSVDMQIIKIQSTADGEILLLTKNKSLFMAQTDSDDAIQIVELYGSDIKQNESRLKSNLFLESEKYLLWIGTDYHISVVAKGDQFNSSFYHQINDRMGNVNFTSCLETSDYFFVGTGSGEIYQIDILSGTIVRYEIGRAKAISHITEMDRNSLIVGCGDLIYQYNIHNRETHCLDIPLQGKEMKRLFVDSDKMLWIEEEKSIVCYNFHKNKFQRFNYPKEGGAQQAGVLIQDGKEMGLFLLTPNGHIGIYHRKTQQLTWSKDLKRLNSFKQAPRFTNFLFDRDGILWLTTSNNGIYKLTIPKQTAILWLPYRSNTIESEANVERVRGLFSSKNGDIWVGTRENRLYRYSKDKELICCFDSSNYEVGKVYHIMEDRTGNLWFSTKGDGVVKAIPDATSSLGFRFERFMHNSEDLNSLNSENVYCTFEDSKGNIWVGTYGGGVNLICDTNGKSVFQHKFNGLDSYPSHGLYLQVRNIEEDHTGRIWIGTTDGLLSVDPEATVDGNYQFETYRNSNSSIVLTNDIYTIYKDIKGQLWFGIFGSGLSRLTGYNQYNGEPTFLSYSLSGSQNGSIVYSMINDRKGELWVASENGISRFNEKTGTFYQSYFDDGLTPLRMEESSVVISEAGELWFGTQDGIFSFFPENQDRTNTYFRTMIVDMKILNKSLVDQPTNLFNDQTVSYAKKVILTHDQASFLLEFSALNYISRNQVTYRYRLESFDKDWHYNGHSRTTSYTRVPPGKYLFRVQSFVDAESPVLSETTLLIQILPPWYKTIWAYIIYLISSVFLGIVVFRFVMHYQKIRNDIYIQNRLSALKIKFFTNISHELRTPLTLIQGPIQELRDHEKLSKKGLLYIDMMEKSTNQMLDLVNQILDFRKIQEGKMRLHISNLRMELLLERVRNEFQLIADEKNIVFSFFNSDNQLRVWGDEDKVLIVIRNILSNAFKFTPDNGMISISASISENKKLCTLRIEDSGIGISAESQKDIFEQFYQDESVWNTKYQGTGIGLALVKEIVNLHKGEIRVNSVPGKGSLFIIEFKMGFDHFNRDEVDIYLEDSVESPNFISTQGEEFLEIRESLPSILLVEDNKDLCKMLSMQLMDEFNVSVAHNGQEGLRKALLQHPDIIVTDQMMPVMSGTEMLQKIRTDFEISHIPVIMLTAKNQDNDKTQAIAMGANAFISKPFNKEYLRVRIHQLLEQRRLYREQLMNSHRIDEKKSVVTDYHSFMENKEIEWMERINYVINENMNDIDFNIDAIAENIGLSRSAFFKKVKSLTGLAPVDLVKEIRLTKSIVLFKSSDLTVSEIAYNVGFRDSGYFGKCFKKKYNLTPREFIAKHRKL